MQAAFQEFTDNAVSKTINAPNSATVDDVRRAYRLAYDMGCKGLTIYRDGSREVQVLTRGARQKRRRRSAEEPEAASAVPAPRAPSPAVGGPRHHPEDTDRLRRRCSSPSTRTIRACSRSSPTWARAAAAPSSQTEATGRLISTAVRAGVDVESIIEQLRGIRCPKPAFQDGSLVFSCSDAIAKALERYIRNGDIEDGKRKARQIAEAKLSRAARAPPRLPRMRLGPADRRGLRRLHRLRLFAVRVSREIGARCQCLRF